LTQNDQGNPAAAENLRFQKTREPPLGLTALFGNLFLRFMLLVVQ